jgi:type VI secretion system protein ImpE
MNANELFRAGNLAEAIKVLTEEVRQNPLDARRRTFLFELLCFAGELDRGEKQLGVLGQGGQMAELGAQFYRAALHAERERQQFFNNKAYAASPELPAPSAVAGVFNGKPFREITDADPRIGPRLEVFLGGHYIWVPFAHIVSIEMQPPKRLRDLLWAPVLVQNGPNFEGRDLGEVITPVLSPFSSAHPDDNVRLGRATVWEDADGAEIPFGQKILLIDGAEVPLLELRKIELTAVGEAAAALG